MTPGINAAKKAKIKFEVHEYTHDPNNESFGDEAAEKLGVPEDQVFKTLVVAYADRKLAVAVVPVSSMLHLKRLAKALQVKKASMAQATDVERTTGYVLGGVSPLGQKKKLPTVIDSSAMEHPTIFVSAGRRGLSIQLAPQDLLSLTKGQFEDIST
ncbi:Cys-tRNA(Pro) deacylase [Desulfopila sp. IMCC35008]|uniref:Cys-tRNA(Pro) deacylase n=1 Tax=Desulfopila sp. IMCC35008 TaxID=2653858 RepID=UPI0013D7A147|nr:Cys-tRNA(Pro) deacylase [Desulfopila sp. IMCC35008]